jgi:transcriptional regulator with XRE-family HTH domain
MKKAKFNSKAFAKAIISKRKELNVGVRGLKSFTGVSGATISRLENQATPDVYTYAAICRWLSVPLETFVK